MQCLNSYDLKAEGSKEKFEMYMYLFKHLLKVIQCLSYTMRLKFVVDGKINVAVFSFGFG